MVDRICYVARRRGEQQGAMCTFFGHARVGAVAAAARSGLSEAPLTGQTCAMVKGPGPTRIPVKRNKPRKQPIQGEEVDARTILLVPLLAADVVASVRRMYADDYALVERLAGFDLDELLANATSA